MKLNDQDEYILKSGRKFYANRGIIGIDNEGNLYEGYSGFLGPAVPYEPLDWAKPAFTPDELVEISEAMIIQWFAIRNKAMEKLYASG